METMGLEQRPARESNSADVPKRVAVTKYRRTGRIVKLSLRNRAGSGRYGLARNFIQQPACAGELAVHGASG
ncbi:hypothetical protein BH23GEM3_BH23GEM3_15200 [soil metagenome]|jgi:hypothetical protein